MPAWKDHCVLGSCVAHNTFFLRFISHISSVVINSIDVIQVHDLVVVKKLLLQEFVLHVIAIFRKGTIRILDILSSFTSISFGVNGFNCNYYREEILSMVYQIHLSASNSSIWSLIVFRCINNEKVMREFLLQTWTKFVRTWQWHVLVCVEIQWYICSISRLSCANVYCNKTFIIGFKLHF